MSPFAIIFAVWISIVAGFNAAAWCFSFFGALNYVWIADVFIAVGTIFIGYRQFRKASRTNTTFNSSLLGDLRSAVTFPPFLILFALIVLAAFIYQPATHDSLSYRIPRIYLWLDGGQIAYVPTTDGRINYMTHAWELTVLPLILGFGIYLVEIPSVISFLLFYLGFHRYLQLQGVHSKRLRWISLIPACSFFAVLQAAGSVNDLFAATFLLLSVVFVAEFEKQRSSVHIIFSSLAAALSAGTKPHYAIFALPLLAWFLFSPSRPFRFFRYRSLLWLTPLLLLTSPLPSFILNQRSAGAMLGEISSPESALRGSNPLETIIIGAAMSTWQAAQLPANPYTRPVAQFLEATSPGQWADHASPKFSLQMSELPIIDGASIGVPVFLTLVIGLIFIVRNGIASKSHRLSLFFFLAGGFCFIIASAFILPMAIGRSFFGFFVAMMFLPLSGLLFTKPRTFKILSSLCFATAAFVLIINPTRPLLPARKIDFLIQQQHGIESLKALFAKYADFRLRADAGIDLVKQVPANSKLLVAAGGGDPLLQLWLSKASGVTISLLPSKADLPIVQQTAPDFIILTPSGPEEHAALIRTLDSMGALTLIQETPYLTRLSRGPEIWKLYKFDKSALAGLESGLSLHP